MKKLGWLLVGVLALALSVASMFAQTTTHRVTANVPFAFYVGKTELPAGQYEIFQPVVTALDLVIRNLDTGKSVVIPILTRTEPNVPGKAELVFKKIEDKPILSEVLPGWTEGYVLSGTREMHAASNASLPKTTVAGE